VKISVVRSGGFAGLTQSASVDTAERTDAAEWHALVDRIDLGALPPPRPQPDRYVYEIDIDGQTAEVGEADLTDPLRDLVGKVLSSFRAGR
jgi:hypothetical protein